MKQSALLTREETSRLIETVKAERFDDGAAVYISVLGSIVECALSRLEDGRPAAAAALLRVALQSVKTSLAEHA